MANISRSYLRKLIRAVSIVELEAAKRKAVLQRAITVKVAMKVSAQIMTLGSAIFVRILATRSRRRMRL